MYTHTYIYIYIHITTHRAPALDREVPAAQIGARALGAPHQDGVPQLERLEVLAHLSPLWELGVGVGEVHLSLGG